MDSFHAYQDCKTTPERIIFSSDSLVVISSKQGLFGLEANGNVGLDKSNDRYRLALGQY